MNVLKHALAFCLIAVATVSARGDEIRIVVGDKLPRAAARALIELREALTDRGERIVDPTKADDKTFTILVGLEGDKVFNDVETRTTAGPTGGPEAASLDLSEPRTLIVKGGDERGLTYALREAARGIALTPRDKPWTDGITPGVEAPFLKVRNVSLHLFNADCEREWFFSEEFWRFYFQRLSLSRFNRCTLTFCDQTNYLCPPYAYLVEMPEYPKIQVADCTAEQRAANRAMLKRIAELADEYAIDFDLGIWMQGPVAKWAAPVQVTGLPEGMELAKYCALGLRRILEACPSIDGIQLRMNAEAGVPEDQQTAFYRPMFQALAAVQAAQRPEHPYRLELRYKGLTPETIAAARAEKLDVTVSTKFWAEHFGLPYHPTTVDSHYAKDRYSFGTLLRKPRDYHVTYQLWTVGSQRLTLWGDPEYAKQFAQSCTLGGSEGFEVFAPLTNKGYGNKPGAWPVIKDPAYRVGKWEQERYWAFYLAFGRLGYNPNTKLEFWHREFKHRFGDAAVNIELAYRTASQVLPLITTALLPSASEWYWWPEMDTSGKLREYSRIPPSDPGRFAALHRWEKTPEWRWEEWDSVPGYLDRTQLDAVGLGNRVPVSSITARLQEHATTLDHILDHMRKQPAQDAESRITRVDLRVLEMLARYHVHKLQAATVLAVAGNDNLDGTTRLQLQLEFAADAWRWIVHETDGVYHDDLVFGITPDMPRSKFGHHHSGHWRDRLPEVEAELADVTARIKQLRKIDGDYEWARDLAKESHIRSLQPRGPQPPRSEPTHSPPRSFRAGEPVTLELQFPPQAQPKYVAVHARPLDQKRPWRPVALLEMPGGVYSVTLPADAVDPHFDLQYYFQVIGDDLAPFLPRRDWFTPPYFVVPVRAK